MKRKPKKKKSNEYNVMNEINSILKAALPIQKPTKKQMNWSQAKKKYPNLNPLGNADGDLFPNVIDCAPFDKKKHGRSKLWTADIEEELKYKLRTDRGKLVRGKPLTPKQEVIRKSLYKEKLRKQWKKRKSTEDFEEQVKNLNLVPEKRKQIIRHLQKYPEDMAVLKKIKKIEVGDMKKISPLSTYRKFDAAGIYDDSDESIGISERKQMIDPDYIEEGEEEEYNKYDGTGGVKGIFSHELEHGKQYLIDKTGKDLHAKATPNTEWRHRPIEIDAMRRQEEKKKAHDNRDQTNIEPLRQFDDVAEKVEKIERPIREDERRKKEFSDSLRESEEVGGHIPVEQVRRYMDDNKDYEEDDETETEEKEE